MTRCRAISNSMWVSKYEQLYLSALIRTLLSTPPIRLLHHVHPIRGMARDVDFSSSTLHTTRTA